MNHESSSLGANILHTAAWAMSSRLHPQPTPFIHTSVT